MLPGCCVRIASCSSSLPSFVEFVHRVADLPSRLNCSMSSAEALLSYPSPFKIEILLPIASDSLYPHVWHHVEDAERMAKGNSVEVSTVHDCDSRVASDMIDLKRRATSW